MNILVFGQGSRANALIDRYIGSGDEVTWLLSQEQSTDVGVKNIIDIFGDDTSLKLVKIDEVNTLRRQTEFHVAHICIQPMYSPVSDDPFNQPQLDAILGIIETVAMNNTGHITVINSMLMGIGGNDRAMFGFSSGGMTYIYMPLLPIDYQDVHQLYVHDSTHPLFPTTPPNMTYFATYGGHDAKNITIPLSLYQYSHQEREMNYLERLAYHAFSTRLILSQLASEIMLNEITADNTLDAEAMVYSVSELTGLKLQYTPEVNYGHGHLSTVSLQYCKKPVYLLLAGAVSHAQATYVTQARIVMKQFNDSSARHIAIYGGDYITYNGIKASLEVAGLLAAEIGEHNIYIIVNHHLQKLPEDWDDEAVFNVMIKQSGGVEIPEKLVDGSSDIDVVI